MTLWDKYTLSESSHINFKTSWSQGKRQTFKISSRSLKCRSTKYDQKISLGRGFPVTNRMEKWKSRLDWWIIVARKGIWWNCFFHLWFFSSFFFRFQLPLRTFWPTYQAIFRFFSYMAGNCNFWCQI